MSIKNEKVCILGHHNKESMNNDLVHKRYKFRNVEKYLNTLNWKIRSNIVCSLQ